jgi:branched-chain amino acid aminotransferase
MAFAETGKIWMNGTFVEWKDATIHIASHVIHYGSGVFEGARCYSTPKGSACFRLDTHMRRLQHSAKIYRMDYPLDLSGWMNAALETVRANAATTPLASIHSRTRWTPRSWSGSGARTSVTRRSSRAWT